MSKKNIARTAIEGGRARHCRDYEEEADRSERRAYRVYCHQARFDAEIEEPSDNSFAAPYSIGKGFRDFDDKLNPVRRWLESQINRPWNNVKSDIVETFDSRTTAGRHILDHIDGFVSLPETRCRYYYLSYRFPGELYVDSNGFLRQEPWRKRRY
jgi:hypothetical protein